MLKLTYIIASLLLPLTLHAQRADNYPPTASMAVELTQTNLPIVFINVEGNMILRDTRITAYMKIIDNGEGQMNYGDTIAHPGQKEDYAGFVSLKYRGNSSFNSSDKKPLSFRPLDKRLEEGGVKQKVKILGMGKDNDWAMLAPFSDKSMLRDVLAFELGRPYFDFVPHSRHCEVVLDGIYYGIYIMTERPTKGKKRLNLNDPGEDNGDLTGDFLVQIDRADEPEYYTSPYKPTDSNGNEISRSVYYQYKAPEPDDFPDLPAGTKQAINNAINQMETSFRSLNYKNPESGYRKYIDVTSFIDYLISTEFGYNIDGYRLSTNLYKYSNTRAANEGLDSRWKMSLWDFNLAYGNANYYDGNRTDRWMYAFNDSYSYDGNIVPFYWQRMFNDENFLTEVQERWAHCRQGAYATNAVIQKVDSMAQVLTMGGAVKRNEEAWRLFGRGVWPNYYVGNDYAEELDYMKGWLWKRGQFMDAEILGEETEVKTEPVEIESGWNADVVAEKSPASSACTNTVDNGRTFYSATVQISGGLPLNREIHAWNGVDYRLASYSQDNALILTSAGQSGELRFKTPSNTNMVHVLATSATGYSLVNATVNYTDGTSDPMRQFAIRDWSCRRVSGNEVRTNMGTIYTSDNSISSDCHYGLYYFSIPANPGKSIASIGFEAATDSRATLLALSMDTSVPSGIDSIIQSDTERSVEGIYNLNGVRMNGMQKGVNILRYSDGTTRKVLVK